MIREYINREDMLNTGREKLNRSIDKSYDAEDTSKQALKDANKLGNEAKQISTEKGNESIAIAKENEKISKEGNLIAKDTNDRMNQIISGETDSAEIIDSRKPLGLEAASTLNERLNMQFGNNEDFRPEKISMTQKMKNEFSDRGVNVMWYGAVGDGIADDTESIKNALRLNKHVVAPCKIFKITEQLNIRQGQTFESLGSSRRNYGNTAIIFYDGEFLEKDTVILLGRNEVGEKPEKDGTSIIFKNFEINCNRKADIGVYGTYLTNESLVDNINVTNSKEIAIYLSCSWYARYSNLSAIRNRNNGILIGYPLLFSDGSSTDWGNETNLQVNNCVLDNIRSNFSGEMFKDITYDINVHSEMGIGIGIGYGNSFNSQIITSENSGGASIIVKLGHDAVKSIRKIYIEKSNVYLSDNNQKAAMIIETSNSNNFSTEISDMFVNPNTGGGIYHKGILGGKIDLINIHQPAFLKSLDGVDERTLSETILKNNVYYKCGYYNNDPKFKVADSVSTVNSRYGFEIDVVNEGTRKEIWVKKLNNKQPWGSLLLNNSDGSTTPMTIPTNLTNNKYVLAGITTGSVISISKGGVTGEEDRDMKVKVVGLIPTYY